MRTNVEAIGRHFDVLLDTLVDSSDDAADDLVVYSVLERGDVSRRRYVVYEDTAAPRPPAADIDRRCGSCPGRSTGLL